MSDFGEWSPCTKECGGGKQSRTREVVQQAENNGTGCGQQPMSQTRTCNVHDCAGKMFFLRNRSRQNDRNKNSWEITINSLFTI